MRSNDERFNSCPRCRTFPDVAGTMPRTVRNNVVLPPPLGPTMAMNCPGQIFNDTRVNAGVAP